jgi:hypothetical protein
MKKLTIAAVLAGALVVPGSAAAVHTTPHLKAMVLAQQAELNCLVRYAASSYLGYAWYEGNGDVHVLTDTTNFGDSSSALDLGVAVGDTSAPDVWLVAVKNTTACKRKLAIGANPYQPRIAASARATHHRLARLERSL